MSGKNPDIFKHFSPQLPHSSSFPRMYKSSMDAPKDMHCSSQIQHSAFLQQRDSFHSTHGKRGVPQNREQILRLLALFA